MEPEKKSDGAFVGLVIIIIILVIGGIYMWQSGKNAKEKMKESEISEQDSVELDALEQDLDALDLNLDVNTESLE